jgi:protein-S-isoprenylcysteine O-methyltransferase Ste14
MKHAGMSPEHPQCHMIQISMTVLFFASWMIDMWSSNNAGYSTLISIIPSLAGWVLAAVSVSIGIYLVSKSHNVIFVSGRRGLVSSGVYSWVRHPMYLGILLFLLGFLFIRTSIFSLAIWILFFLAYDMLATYEERNLVKKFGKRYKDYQKKVGKWFPRF